MSFLGGLGKGLSRAFDGTNLAITQAILAGDYQGAAALRARQGELQRQLQQDSEQHNARDRQVIGAKNLGFNGDEIDGMTGPELATAVRQRAAMRMFGPSAGAGGGEGGGQTPPVDGAGSPAPLPSGAAPQPSGMSPPRINYMPARLRVLPPGLGSSFAPGSASDGTSGGLASLPRVSTPGQAAALPNGSLFIGPDGSIRRIN